ncbi:MAG: elongation factor P hydroxylase [Moraxella sp.]|nr:elongation factor P hydroxylase [Moraxella sp.]
MSIQFNHLSPSPIINTLADSEQIIALWHGFYHDSAVQADIAELTAHMDKQCWITYQTHWQALQTPTSTENDLTNWLIILFNNLFNQPNFCAMPTVLVRGAGEPEYFAADNTHPARIEFAHGFFQSALHEISHWCIAGKQRRTLNDFGYWYAADGRDKNTQTLFEQVEIMPQAIECLLSLACGRYFYVSQDNLNADFDTSNSTFASDVFTKAHEFLQQPQRLPRDARRLLWALLAICQPSDYNAYSQMNSL